MKTLVKVLIPSLLILAVLSACQEKKNSDEETLLSKRDSLIEIQLDIKQQLIEIDKELALLRAGDTKDDIKIIKQIAQQKSKIAKIDKKITELEGQLSPDKHAKLTPVGVKTIMPEVFSHYIKVYGSVEAENYANISPEMGGRVEVIYVNEGQQVNKGDLLVSMNTQAIDKQIQGLEGSLELASSTFEKQKSLWDQEIGSEIQYLSAKNNKENLEAQLEALKAQKRMAEIRAPFNGLVNKIYLKKGELASPGFPVVEFVNLKDITIRADVPEEYIHDVKKNQEVRLTFASLEDTIRTPVRRVSEVIDAKSRTFEIELNVNNPDGQIKPNMVSTIEIRDFNREHAFVVPSLVIRKDFTGDYVYVVVEEDGKDVIRKKSVESELSYNDQTYIKSGLAEGDRVVVKGYHLVSNGIPVKVIEKKSKK